MSKKGKKKPQQSQPKPAAPPTATVTKADTKTEQPQVFVSLASLGTASTAKPTASPITATAPATTATPCESSAEYSEDRRSFCKTAVAAGLAAVAVAPAVVAGVRVVLSAPEQKSKEARFFQLATLDTLTKTPQKFLIADDVEDGWMFSPQQKIGAVFLSLDNEGNVHAFQSLCPHAGCTVEVSVRENPQTQVTEPLFYCPCHVASFDLSGVRLDEKSQSPRDLDTLEVKVEDGKVFVKFEKFLSGIPEKVIA